MMCPRISICYNGRVRRESDEKTLRLPVRHRLREVVMKKSLLAVILAATGLWPLSKASFLESQASAPARSARAAADGLALTPPMGWYPWNAFGEAPQNEALIREIAAAMVSSGLKDSGYAYVGPDEGICFSRGGDGLLAPNLERYPSGLRGLGDAIHKMGLKY
ncbi:MAG: hypothetical protein FJY80_13815, partial [Candidatus Aminicenantes bacterium]|nr:hypothetical protein [Candidatus Aminicenantes bacterium]